MRSPLGEWSMWFRPKGSNNKLWVERKSGDDVREIKTALKAEQHEKNVEKVLNNQTMMGENGKFAKQNIPAADGKSVNWMC